MAYTIHKFDERGAGEMLASGYTRQQVIRALDQLGHIDKIYGVKGWPYKLPRFGKGLLISRPKYDPRGDYIINHV